MALATLSTSLLQYPPLYKPLTHHSSNFCKSYWLSSNPELPNAMCTALLCEQMFGIFINSCPGSVRWRGATILCGSLYKSSSILAHNMLKHRLLNSIIWEFQEIHTPKAGRGKGYVSFSQRSVFPALFEGL